jgi:hypothetical protein
MAVAIVAVGLHPRQGSTGESLRHCHEQGCRNAFASDIRDRKPIWSSPILATS